MYRIKIETEKDKNNVVTGSKYDDIIECGNKNNTITDLNGDNYIYASKKGNANITTGDGDDYFIIPTLNKVIVINDDGGTNTIGIEESAKNAHVFFDVASSSSEGEINTDIAIIDIISSTRVKPNTLPQYLKSIFLFSLFYTLN